MSRRRDAERLQGLVNLDALTVIFRESAAAGQPVVFRADREPPGHVRALMDTLGVPVEVRAVSAVVNQDVRVREGVGGEIVVVSAYCPKCKQQSTATAEGCCLFCGTRILDEDTLSAKAMRAQLTNSNGHSGSNPESDRTATVRRTYSADDACDALREKAAVLGHVPYSSEWQRLGFTPSNGPMYKHFGSWAAACEAAGLPEPGEPYQVSGPGPSAPAPTTGTAVEASPRPEATEPGPDPEPPITLPPPRPESTDQPYITRMSDALDEAHATVEILRAALLAIADLDEAIRKRVAKRVSALLAEAAA